TFLRHYNFTTDESTSSFQQVAIDPEMLGRIFENLLAEQIEETGEQARKAKGAFYTPREIVDYMCKESLREYLKTKITEGHDRDQRISQLLDSKPHEWRDQQRNYRDKLKPYKADIIDALDNIKVIDPACGSGAFPMGMLHLLLQCYERLEPRFDSYKNKLEIIKNNLYGVDIEPMAVEISRLRAWLSIIVDEDVDSKKIKPLPNLDFKFVCANSLIPLEKGQRSLGDDTNLENQILEIRDRYYNAKKYSTKLKLREQYDKLILEKKQKSLFGKSQRQEQVETYHPFDPENITLFFDPGFMFGVCAFDIVIGNPPYVSTKGRSSIDKVTLKNIYGFADDLYSHFYFRGLEIAFNNTGILSFISSKTFWTIQTKKNLRKYFSSKQIIELFDTAYPFAAMVDTCVVIVKNSTIDDNYEFRFKDGKQSLNEPINYLADIALYRKAVNNVFFIPNNFNLAIYHKYNDVVRELMDKWWPKIATSKKISQNNADLSKYRKALKSGDIALLGTLTDGGQGLATANNGRFIGVRAGSKQAKAIESTRPKKLFNAVQKYNIAIPIKDKNDAKAFLHKKNEKAVIALFDKLKEEYGRDIFGQGYIYRIISEKEIADVGKLTPDEKLNGIPKSKPYYVPYDKGDKDGNRWYLETPFVIDWSKESVSILQKDKRARWQGYTFYFKEGFCWSDIHTVLIKSRIKAKGVYDVKSMSLFSQCDRLPDWYFVAILNSTFISEYDFNFVNNTQTFQINDARQIPIIIPTEKQLAEFKEIFDDAMKIKKAQFFSNMNMKQAEVQLLEIQKRLDEKVYALYGVTPEDTAIVEGGKQDHG
ncbi:MAG: Eco57I restriction-modification methylase domain-containing protein, partial [Candidatus Hodarchaeales archaeon]